MSASLSLLGGLVLVAGVAAATALMISALKPVLRRYALARPNARSSHSVPTPQGAGIAIISVMVVFVGAILAVAVKAYNAQNQFPEDVYDDLPPPDDEFGPPEEGESHSSEGDGEVPDDSRDQPQPPE